MVEIEAVMQNQKSYEQTVSKAKTVFLSHGRRRIFGRLPDFIQGNCCRYGNIRGQA